MQLYIHKPRESAGESYSFRPPPSKSLLARRMLLEYILGDDRISWTSWGSEMETLPEDITALRSALVSLRAGAELIDVGESGTAMRLMTAVLTTEQGRSFRLVGQGRQHQRPISPLVEALRELGADIEYLDQEGYPPLKIGGRRLKAKAIMLNASQSSQYLSALLLVAPRVEGMGYQIDTTVGRSVSTPYVEMTLATMREVGLYWQQEGGVYSYIGSPLARQMCTCLTAGRGELDWTAASYAYLLQSLLQKPIRLDGLLLPSLQGDSKVLPELMLGLGVQTLRGEDGVLFLSSVAAPNEGESLYLDCRTYPDLVPSLVAMCIGRRQAFSFEGVAHLRLKESDRLEALRQESLKVGIALELGESSISWGGELTSSLMATVELDPHGDHRIAMAMAPLMATLSPTGVLVKDAEVVSKSFPHYWIELRRLGFEIINKEEK